MAITYPLSLPVGARPVSMRFGGNAVVGVARSPFTLSTQAQVWPGQGWEAEVDLPKMTRASAEAWCCFGLALNGRQGTFLMGDPMASARRGSASGTPLVDGASQAGRTLDTKGWTPNAAGVLLAGDYLQLGSGSSAHLHKVLTDVNADGDGKATLDIWPDLRVSPVDGAALVVSNALGLWRLSSNQVRWEVARLLYGFSFEVEEAL